VQKISESVFIASSILFFLLVKEHGALSDFEGNLIGSFLFMTFFAPSYLRNFKWSINVSMIKTVLSLGFPLVLHGSANILVNIGDRFLLKHFMDISNVGIYTLAYQIGQVMSVVTNSINQSWQAQFLKKMIDDKNYNPNKETALIAIVNSIIGVAITGGTLLFFDVLFDMRYELVKKITPIVIISYLMHYFYAISNSLIFLNKKNHLLASITIISVLINFTLNYFFIPTLGIMGAAYASVLTMIVRGLITIFIAERIQANVFNYTQPIIAVTVASFVISAMIFFNSKNAVLILSTFYIIPATIIFIYLSRRTNSSTVD
jgi:O-antigen/teichoic acid export membrane protein